MVALDQLVALVVWVAPKAATTDMEYILTVEILTTILTIRIVMEVSTGVNGSFHFISEKKGGWLFFQRPLKQFKANFNPSDRCLCLNPSYAKSWYRSSQKQTNRYP